VTKRWRKSRRSNSGGNCVEVADTLDALRDSKNPSGGVLTIDRRTFVRFLEAVKADLL